MNLIARIILWGLLLLMLKDANSQSRSENNAIVAVTTSSMD
jgi:hypothetical protein